MGKPEDEFDVGSAITEGAEAFGLDETALEEAVRTELTTLVAREIAERIKASTEEGKDRSKGKKTSATWGR